MWLPKETLDFPSIDRSQISDKLFSLVDKHQKILIQQYIEIFNGENSF